MAEKDWLLETTDRIIGSIVDEHRKAGLPDDVIGDALGIMGMMFRSAHCELAGIPVEVDKTTERYKMLHILVSDMLSVRLHPNTVEAAADRHVADIFDIFEVTK